MPTIVSISDGPWGSAVVYDPDKSEENLQKEKSPPVLLSLEKIVEEEGKDKENYEDRAVPKKEEALEEARNTTLPYIYSSLFGTILEDTMIQMRILVEGNNEMKVFKVNSDWNKLLAIKFAVRQPVSVDELEGIDPQNLGCHKYKINKLESDKTYITNVIISTYVDLSMNKSFKALADFVNATVARDDYRIDLAEDEAKNKVLRHELSKQLRQLRNHAKSVIYDADAKISELKTQVEDSGLLAQCRDRYIENWQRARTEQHIKTIEDNESVYSDVVEYYKLRTDHEHRVHMEVEMLVKIAINDTLEKIDKMMNKYDNDMEAIDLKIQFKKLDYQLMLEKRIKLEKTLEEHENMMKAWVTFKDEREKARAYREKMTKSAIVVQAWWRGLLVRMQLGPYRVNKKKGQASKKK